MLIPFNNRCHRENAWYPRGENTIVILTMPILLSMQAPFWFSFLFWFHNTYYLGEFHFGSFLLLWFVYKTHNSLRCVICSF